MQKGYHYKIVCGTTGCKEFLTIAVNRHNQTHRKKAETAAKNTGWDKTFAGPWLCPQCTGNTKPPFKPVLPAVKNAVGQIRQESLPANAKKIGEITTEDGQVLPVFEEPPPEKPN